MQNDVVENGIQKSNFNQKRTGYISWDEYFMATAFLAAKRSKDPVTQVGACVVNDDNQIVGIGYNGMPRGCSDDEFPWGKSSENKLENKYFYVCHAEMNAILNTNSLSVKNCKIYVGLFPCNECAKFIIQSGIKEIVYLSDKKKSQPKTMASKRMLDHAGVKYWQFVPEKKEIVINFMEIDWNNMSQDPLSPVKGTV